MLRLIFGHDTFTVREKLRELLSQYVGDESPLQGAHWIDGRSATPRDVIEAAGQVSMFAATKIVVVEGLLSRLTRGDARRKVARGRKRNGRSGELGEWEGFSEKVRGLPESSVLILTDGEVKEPNPLLDELAAVAGDTVRCPFLAAPELVRWVQERVARRGGRIEAAAASRLAAIVGPDLWLMHSELEKLVIYADGQPITVNMVDGMAASAPAPTIFALVDAMVEQDMQQARRRLDDLYHKGLPAGYVFTMVARQLRLIAQAHEARGRHSGPVAGELAGLAPFALQRAMRQAQRLSEDATRQALERVVAADRAIKTGTFTDRMALDMLITDIAAPMAG